MEKFYLVLARQLIFALGFLMLVVYPEGASAQFRQNFKPYGSNSRWVTQDGEVVSKEGEVPAQQGEVPAQEDVKPEEKVVSGKPKIALCSVNDVQGLWRMENLYETPEGDETRAFEENPERYLELGAKSEYSGVSGKTRFKDYKSLKSELSVTAKSDLWQYVLDTNGVFYIYKNRVVSMAFYCAIAKEDKGGYKVGDMILTPKSPGQTTVFRQYRKIVLP